MANVVTNTREVVLNDTANNYLFGETAAAVQRIEMRAPTSNASTTSTPMNPLGGSMILIGENPSGSPIKDSKGMAISTGTDGIFFATDGNWASQQKDRYDSIHGKWQVDVGSTWTVTTGGNVTFNITGSFKQNVTVDSIWTQLGKMTWSQFGSLQQKLTAGWYFNVAIGGTLAINLSAGLAFHLLSDNKICILSSDFNILKRSYSLVKLDGALKTGKIEGFFDWLNIFNSKAAVVKADTAAAKTKAAAASTENAITNLKNKVSSIDQDLCHVWNRTLGNEVGSNSCRIYALFSDI